MRPLQPWAAKCNRIAGGRSPPSPRREKSIILRCTQSGGDRMQFDQLRRREFITLLGGAAAALSRATRAQEAERIRRIGILFGGFSDTDPEPRARVAAFTQGLHDLGWT